MMEKLFSLDDIDYQHFWGTNEHTLEFIRILFPKLKLIVRGEMLKVIGNDEDLEVFEIKFNAMRQYFEHF